MKTSFVFVRSQKANSKRSLRGEEKNDALGLEMGHVKRIAVLEFSNDAYA